VALLTLADDLGSERLERDPVRQVNISAFATFALRVARSA
jgi:hypothetical protein